MAPAASEGNLTLLEAILEISVEEEWGDPCQEFAHSVLFFINFSLATVGWIAYFFTSIKTKQFFSSGSSILYVLLFVFSAIRFGPKVWGALQVHGYFHFSQTGCKLIAFTEFGLRHVTCALIILLTAYAWFRLYKTQIDVDTLIRENIAWLILFLFTLEGATGMFPSIYSDVDPDWSRCDFSKVESESETTFLASQVILSSLLPYVLPFLGMIYPLYIMTFSVAESDDVQVRTSVRNILIVVWTHVLLSTPWALHALIMLPMMEKWSPENGGHSVCVLDGLFRLLLEMWHVIAPIVTVYGDPLLRNQMPGSHYLEKALSYFTSVVLNRRL